MHVFHGYVLQRVWSCVCTQPILVIRLWQWDGLIVIFVNVLPVESMCLACCLGDWCWHCFDLWWSALLFRGTLFSLIFLQLPQTGNAPLNSRLARCLKRHWMFRDNNSSSNDSKSIWNATVLKDLCIYILIKWWLDNILCLNCGWGSEIIIPQGTPFPAHPGLNHCSWFCTRPRTDKLETGPSHAPTSAPWCVWSSAGQTWDWSPTASAL